MDVGTGAVVTGDADGDRPPEFVPRELGEFLRRAGERVESLVLAVPDSWFDGDGDGDGNGDGDGAARREALYGELIARLGLPLRQFVSQTVAAAACGVQDAPDACPDRLVLRIGTEEVCAGLCHVSGPSVGLVATESRPISGHGVELVALARAHREAGSDRGRRAALLLARARTVPRYRAAPVHACETAEGRRTMTAGAVIDGFETVAEALRATVTGLLDRCPPGPRPSAEHRVLVSGDLNAHPLALVAVRDSLRDPMPEPGPQVLDPHATALGALRIAQGAVRAPETARHSLTLFAHRLRRGRPAEVRIPLTVTGAAMPMTVMDGGEPLTVDIPTASGFRVGIDVQEYGQGPYRALELPCPGLPAGSAQVGLHPAGTGFGVLVLRPVGGGESVLLPLGGPVGRGVTTTEAGR
jgi:hypothetical protein